jgi:hypothetical protein
MTALALLATLNEAGLLLEIDADGGLAVDGREDIVDRWLPSVRANKAAIVAVLANTRPSCSHSTWGLVNYLDGASAEVWTNPPTTEVEVLERRPDAIAAQTLHQAAQSPISACVTCVHVTGRGGCGEPVASGLSDVVGVIVYHDGAGKDCPAWMATFPDDLEHLIEESAAYWQSNADDLSLIRETAHRDPEGTRRSPPRPFYDTKPQPRRTPA